MIKSLKNNTYLNFKEKYLQLIGSIMLIPLIREYFLMFKLLFHNIILYIVLYYKYNILYFNMFLLINFHCYSTII